MGVKLVMDDDGSKVKLLRI